MKKLIISFMILSTVGCLAKGPKTIKRVQVFQQKVEVQDTLNIGQASKEESAILRLDGQNENYFAILRDGKEVGSISSDQNNDLRIRTIGIDKSIVISPSGVPAEKYTLVAFSESKKVFGSIVPAKDLVGVVRPRYMNVRALFSTNNGWVIPRGTKTVWDWRRFDGKKLVGDMGAEERPVQE